jgi:hypothetical protein
MGRVLTSPVKRWAGTVTLADPLTFPAYIAWRDAVLNAQQHAGDHLAYTAALLPGLLACVEKWDLQGFTPDPFPATPRDSSNKLLTWLLREISAIANEAGEDDDPK